MYSLSLVLSMLYAIIYTRCTAACNVYACEVARGAASKLTHESRRSPAAEDLVRFSKSAFPLVIKPISVASAETRRSPPQLGKLVMLVPFVILFAEGSLPQGLKAQCYLQAPRRRF